ncbi:MAG: hypothetical protein WDN72_10225 [Alphaproteobacteria bacterium]
MTPRLTVSAPSSAAPIRTWTEELNRTRLELALINDRVRALMNLGDRTNMVAFRSLVAALIQSERFGTSLTDTLRVLSEDFRLLRLSAAEAKRPPPARAPYYPTDFPADAGLYFSHPRPRHRHLRAFRPHLRRPLSPGGMEFLPGILI